MLVIKGGTILTPEERIEGGALLIEDGKILEVGKDVAVPPDAEVIDAQGKYIIPGLIDAHCHTGLFPDGVGHEQSDGNEMTDPVTPHLRAIDAIHPEDMAFDDLRRAGVTTINTGPGSANVVGGQTAIVKTWGRTVEEMLVRAPAAMKMALGENPKRVYGEQKKTPSTRMGNAAVLREWLTKAQNYLERWERYKRRLAECKAGEKEPEPPERDLRLEELARVLKGEIPAHIHAHRADDILTALRIADEFGIKKLVLIHATEGYKVADILAGRGVPCVVGPILFSRRKYELRGMTPKNPAILSRAGVKVAIQTDQMSAVKYILFDAALAVREGMDEGEALKAITINPAEILGVADRVGSLEPGKDADLVILSAHPFELTKSRVEVVLIDGKIVYRKEEG
ncbi:MAG: Amidohydrolase [Acetothermia bacterium 64_32]|nr:MAG: Amidohydrolase [Acetothermia bacterium 64_32]HAF71384.1 amidohydrolase [Candidatus Acetothermia bacterium]